MVDTELQRRSRALDVLLDLFRFGRDEDLFHLRLGDLYRFLSRQLCLSLAPILRKMGVFKDQVPFGLVVPIDESTQVGQGIPWKTSPQAFVELVQQCLATMGEGDGYRAPDPGQFFFRHQAGIDQSRGSPFRDFERSIHHHTSGIIPR